MTIISILTYLGIILPIAGLVLVIGRAIAKRTTNKVDDEVVEAAQEVVDALGKLKK